MNLITIARSLPRNFCELFIEPHAGTADQRRQERILNILLVSLAAVGLLALGVSSFNYVASDVAHSQNSLLFTGTFFALSLALVALSRLRHTRLATIGFLSLLTIAALQLTLQWSFELQQALLVYVLIITIGGVISKARYGLLFALVMSALYLGISFLQANGSLVPDTSWQRPGLNFSDAIGYAITFFIIGLVSWLSNHEIDRSLNRARVSERALAAERDSLEAKVIERTRQIEEQQLIRLMELRRFAEFGRLSANLLHEVANPLTAASINLELIESEQYSKQVVQARKNLQHLERYVEAARKQLKGEGEVTRFAIRSELQQLLRILTPYAARHQVEIVSTVIGQPRLYGDAVKFNQLTANLLLNAVEAYDETDTNRLKQVVIAVKAVPGGVRCTVSDQGKGIKKSDLKHLFKSFYTTKSDRGQNMGIGLSMVKQFVEQDFNGTIAVSSSPEGTVFDVMLQSVR